MWDEGGSADTDELEWSELTTEQQSAATALGYNQQIWDQDESGASVAASYVSVDNDYIFLAPASNTWVSRYMILYFAAALCFVFVGIIDFCRAPSNALFHINMILPGLFGLASAMLLEKHRLASNVLNLISVHFFLFEGLNICRVRFQLNVPNQRKGANNAEAMPLTSDLWWVPTVLVLADVCFVAGAVMDVVLSYFYLGL